MHFCGDCHNLTFIHTTEDKKLIHLCKTCNKTEEYEGDGSVFSQNFNPIDRSEILNSNKYINHDITLPFIENNPNIKCPNAECESRKDGHSMIKYLKHDYANMKYTYICDHCGQKWSN